MRYTGPRLNVSSEVMKDPNELKLGSLDCATGADINIIYVPVTELYENLRQYDRNWHISRKLIHGKITNISSENSHMCQDSAKIHSDVHIECEDHNCMSYTSVAMSV